MTLLHIIDQVLRKPAKNDLQLDNLHSKYTCWDCTVSGMSVCGVETISDRQPPGEKCSSGCHQYDEKNWIRISVCMWVLQMLFNFQAKRVKCVLLSHTVRISPICKVFWLNSVIKEVKFNIILDRHGKTWIALAAQFWCVHCNLSEYIVG